MMNEDNKIFFSNGVVVGQNCWSCSEDGQIICKTDITTGKVRIIKCLDKRISGYSYYYTVIYIGQKLYFIPLLAEVLLVYDINENKLEEYEISSNICHGRGAKFISAGSYEDNVYMFPCCTDHICRFNVISKQIEYLQNIACLQERNDITGLTYCFGTGTVCDDIFWLPVIGRDMIVAYSMRTNEYKEYEINSNEEGFRYLVKTDDDFYLLTRDGNVVYWNLDKGFCRKYEKKNITEKIELGRNVYSKMAYYQNAIWLFPAFGENIVCLDLLSGHREEYVDYKNELKESEAINEVGVFGEGIQNEEEMIMFPRTLDGLVRINLRTKEISTVRLRHNISDIIFLQDKFEGAKLQENNIGKIILEHIMG